MSQAEETLSFEQIIEYLDNHPKIYQYIINKSPEELALNNGHFTFIDVMTNSIVLFLAIRKRLGWEIWKKDMEGPFYNKSQNILYESELLAEINTFTISELYKLLRFSNGFLGYVAYERLPSVFSGDNTGKDMLCMLKALFKYRYKTNEDFDLVFGPKEEEIGASLSDSEGEQLESVTLVKDSEDNVPKYISGNIFEGMTTEEIKTWSLERAGAIAKDSERF